MKLMEFSIIPTLEPFRQRESTNNGILLLEQWKAKPQ